MQRIIFYLTVLISTTVWAQESAEQAAEQTIKTFFEGFHKGDTTLMKSVMMDKVLMQTVYKTKEGKDVLVTDEPGKLVTAVANRPSDQKWEEKILGYSVKVDGNMAHVWTPYEFRFNGDFSHCGVNSFQLFHDNGTWKIIYLIDTRRRQGCQD